MDALDQMLAQQAAMPASAAGATGVPGAGGGDALDAMLSAQARSTPGRPMQAPSPLGGDFQNYLAGGGKLVADTATGTKQLVNDLAAGAQNALKDTSVGRGIDWLNQHLGLQAPADIQQQGRADIAETRRLDAPLMGTKAGQAGYGSAALMTAPLSPATAGYRGAAATGVAMGLTQPAMDWTERAKNTGISTAAAIGGQAVVNGLSRVIRPQTPQSVTDLIAAGVTPTPGQILGGGFKKAEEGLTSIPVIGDFIKNAQNRGIGQLNDAVANRALAPVGEKLPAGLGGREAVDYVGSTLGAKYDALLPNMSAQLDPQFARQVNSLTNLVNGGNMGQAESQQFMKILKSTVFDRFQGQGAITGETAKAMNSDLGRISSNYARDPSFDKRQLGDAVGELQDAVRGLMVRQNPTLAPQLNAIDSGYAVFKRMQRAAAGVGAEDGVFNPAQLQSAVKALDRSKDKGAFARGGALLQDMSDPAKAIMAPRLADSGTPYRSLLMAGAAGAAGHFISPMAAIPALTMPLLYTRPGQAMAAALLARRPAGAAQLSGLLGTAAPAAGLLGPALSYGVQQ